MGRTPENEDSRITKLYKAYEEALHDPESVKEMNDLVGEREPWYVFVFYDDNVVEYKTAYTREEIEPFIQKYKTLTIGIFHGGEWVY